MKKVLVSLAALATVSCAAVTASAASSVDFELNAAKSNAETKVIDVIVNSDEVTSVKNAFIDITFGDTVDPSAVVIASDFADAYMEEFEGQTWLLVADNGADAISLVGNKLKIAELTIPAADTTLSIPAYDEVEDLLHISLTTIGAYEELSDFNCDKGTIAVVDAADLGTFTDGEGAPAKAFKAAAAVEGDITWFVTDGTNVASKAVTEVTGGADVVVGLVATGANVANINYATVTID